MENNNQRRSTERSEEVVFLAEALTKEHLKKYIGGRRHIILVDEIILTLYTKVFSGLNTYALPSGEGAKTLEVYENVLKAINISYLTRAGVVVSVGGGATSDVAGFVASTYMRGVDLINIPTTLLAMCDAAIGGKNALNITAKNEVGTFYPPEKVIIDTNFLKTLPQKDMKSGAGELLKYAIGFEPKMLDMLLESDYTDSGTFDSLIRHAAWIKQDVVEKDLRDGGIRKTLNFGHTLGHAVEFSSEFELSHGEAVAIGTYHMTRWAQREKLISSREMSKIEKAYDYLKLPRFIPKNLDRNKVFANVLNDKKSLGETIDVIKLRRLGRLAVYRMPIDQFFKEITMLEDKPFIPVAATPLSHGYLGEQKEDDSRVCAIYVPVSKSYAHRFLIMGAFADTPTTIERFALSDDLKATIQALEVLSGAKFVFTDDDLVVYPGTNNEDVQEGKSIASEGFQERKEEDENTQKNSASDSAEGSVYGDVEDSADGGESTGVIGDSASAIAEVDFGESASSARFLIPFVGIKQSGRIRFKGAPSLEKRTMEPILDILSAQGILCTEEGLERREQDEHANCEEEHSVFPTTLPFEVEGRVRAGVFRPSGEVSSQFLSGLLMAAPKFEGKSRIVLGVNQVSTPYIGMTLDAMKKMGVNLSLKNGAYTVMPASYRALKKIVVERDYSQAAFWIVAEILRQERRASIPKILLPGLNKQSLQADREILSILGVEIMKNGEIKRVSIPRRQFDIRNCPDLFPILAVYFSLSGGADITGVDRLVHKESDRLGAMIEEISKMGGEFVQKKDMVEIVSSPLTGADLSSHGDHRIAMALSVLSLFVPETTIDTMEPVKKSYPKFLEDFVRLTNMKN